MNIWQLAISDQKGYLSGRKSILVRAPVKLKTVMLKGRDFYSTLRNKLMWGADRRN